MYALEHLGPPAGPPPAEAVRDALVRLRSGRAVASPVSPAVAGLLAVAAAEHPELGLLPAARLGRLAPALGPVPRVSAAPSGPWSRRIAAALPQGHGEAARLAIVEPAPDAPLRALDPDRAARAVEQALAAFEPAPLVVVPADGVVGRPLGALTAAIAHALAAVVLARGGRALFVGPCADAPGARVLGVAPLHPEALRAALRSFLAGGPAAQVALDVDWPAAVAAFPHLRPLAEGLLRPEPLVAIVRAEAARVLRAEAPAVERPLRELGLDSLGAEELRLRLEERLGRPLPRTLLFEHPTISALAEHLAQDAKGPR